MAPASIFTIPVTLHLGLRLGGLTLSATTLYYLAYLATTWNHKFGGAISSATVAIVVDLAAFGFLFAARYNLLPYHTGWTTVGEILVIILGCIGIAEHINSSWHYSDAPTNYARPWSTTEDITLGLLSGLVVLRVLFMVIECVACCVSHKRKKRQRRWTEPEGHELAAKSVVSED